MHISSRTYWNSFTAITIGMPHSSKNILPMFSEWQAATNTILISFLSPERRFLILVSVNFSKIPIFSF